MEIARLGLQAAYAPGTTAAASVTGVGEVAGHETATAKANQTELSQPPASTKVSLSAAGQARLAAEQQGENEAAEAPRQSATLTQNAPVVAAREAAESRNEPAEATTTATEPARSGAAAPAAPLQQASVTTPTGGATPAPATDAASRSEAASRAARADASAVQTRAENVPATSSRAPAAPAQAPARQQVEQAAQQNRERQNTAAQARQDVSPVLAHSGVTTYREVLSM